MINTSSDYKSQVLKDGCRWKALAEITYHDGAVASISNEDIMEKGISFSDGTSQKDVFCVGSLVSKSLTLKLCNFENKFVADRFQGAQIHLKLGLFIESTQLWEWIDLGTFFVDKHPMSGGVITLTMYNNASKFEKKYDSTLAYPATLAEILQDACINCGVTLYSTTFPNSDYVVATRPSDDATTYADIVSDVAQLSACFAKCNNLGQLALDWYDLDRFYPESGDTVDGGDFSSYSQIDSIDGGSFYPSAPAIDGGSFADYADDDTYDGGGFTDYSEADSLDGGNFIDYGATPSNVLSGGVFRKNLLTPARIASLTSYEIASKDIRITGVQLVPMDKSKPTLKKGVDGYVISIEKNPLAQDNLDALVNFLAYRLIDFSFRPMNATGWDDPSYEAGDVAILADPYGNQYQTIISNLEYTFGDYESYSADAESESENQSVNFSEGAKAVQEARDDTEKQISVYDQFNELSSLAIGVYRTQQKLDDGSTVYYLHDKPKLSDSQNIWKRNAEGIFISHNGGATYDAGVDDNGNAKFNMLSAVGIVADWIRCGGSGVNGKFTVKDASDNDMLILDNRGITMQNGAKLMGGNGVLSSFVFGSGYIRNFGIQSSDGEKSGNYGFIGQNINVNYFLPPGFVVTSAVIDLIIYATYYEDVEYFPDANHQELSDIQEWSGFGAPMNIVIKHTSQINKILPYSMYSVGDVDVMHSSLFSDITNEAFGANSISPVVDPHWNKDSLDTNFGTEFVSNNIASLLSQKGEIGFTVSSFPTWNQWDSQKVWAQNSGMAVANLMITGYQS